MSNADIKQEEGYVDQGHVRLNFRTLLRYIGPGLIMCIAFVDPGNLEADLITGALTGYSLLWLVPLCSIMGLYLQQFAAKLGVVTGKHLAQICRGYYPAIPRYLVWIMMEIAVISSDMQEVIGSAIAIRLLSQGAVPLSIGVLITAFDTFLLLFLGWLGAQKLEMLFGFFIAVMCTTFGVIYFRVGISHTQVLKGLVIPQLDRQNLSYAVAMLGALIMPHNIYLHSAIVLSRYNPKDGVQYRKEAIRYVFMEAALAVFFTVFINVFVISVFAKGFFGRDVQDIGLMSAGEYLKDQFGEAVVVIWGLGLLAAGQASTMSGTYTGQFVMSGFLNLKVKPFWRVIITRSMAIVPTLFMVIFSHSSNALDTMNEWINLLQALQLPFALLPVISVTNDRAIMGDFYNKRWEQLIAYTCTALIIIINLGGVIQQEITLFYLNRPLGIFCLFLIIAYLVFVTYLLLYPFVKYLNLHKQQNELQNNIQYQIDDQINQPLLNGEQIGHVSASSSGTSYQPNYEEK